MRLFVLRRKIGIYWRKRMVRAAAAALVLIAAIILQYYLANKPLPIDVNAANHKYTPAIVKFKQEELVIENPVLNSNRVLFRFNGQVNEFVNVDFEKARLSEETFALFKKQGDAPSSPGPEIIKFEITDVAQKLREELPKLPEELRAKVMEKLNAAKQDGLCLISVTTKVASDSKLPTKIHFYQPESSISSRDFYMMVDADLVVGLDVSAPDDEQQQPNDLAPGCGHQLVVGEWDTVLTSGKIQIIATANSVLHFTFLQYEPDSLWKGPKDPFSPFIFGAKPLQAQRISVNPMSGDRPSTSSSPPILSASAKDEPLLINNLMVSAEEIQLDFSGTALVQTRGEYVTGDLLDRLKKYPLIAGLFALGNAALLGWIIRIFKGIISGH